MGRRPRPRWSTSRCWTSLASPWSTRSADAVEPSGEAGGAEDGEGSAAPKKKTRRGTRGGRSRRKKTAVAVEGQAVEGEAVEGPADGEADPEGGVLTAVVDEPAAPAAIEPEARPEPDEAAEAEPGYVPMSEWLDDFDRR